MPDGDLAYEQALQRAESELFAHYGLQVESRFLQLKDPALRVRVLEAGQGDPALFVHGSGMCAATWAAVLPHLHDRRLIAVDLPGFGLSDAYSYAGRSLREHAVAQMISLLDALGLDRAAIVGTSLGGMWALCTARDAPARVRSVVSFGMPAVILPGLRPEIFFRLMTTPGLGRLIAKAPPPKSIAMTRKATRGPLGARLAAEAPDAFFELVRTAMTKPGWGTAMWTHLNLAMRFGHARPENAFDDGDLRSIEAPVSLVWGESDIYGGPEIGRQAAEVLPHATLEVLPGGHAPFLDHPARAAQVITAAG